MLPRSLTAVLLAALASLALAGPALAGPNDLPRLTEAAPTLAERFWFDDHSIGGDNHLGWHYTGTQGQSDLESQGIKFQVSMGVGGAGGLEVCGYPSGVAGWRRAYQMTPGDIGAGTCPPSEPTTGQVGWFRYVYANHDDSNPPAFNRWHLMDMERFALVPLPTAMNGPTGGAPVVWDSHWGTCMNFDQGATMSCQQSIDAGALDVGVHLGGSKYTQVGDPDAQIIPIIPAVGSQLPDGDYQVVVMSNPYGLLKEPGGAIGSVACANIHVNVGPYGDVTVGPPTLVNQGTPATCYVPTTLDPALTGPGGYDPMAGAGPTTPWCPLRPETGHCWASVPTGGDYKPASTHATGDAVRAQTAPLPQGSAIPASIAATGLPLGPLPPVPSSSTNNQATPPSTTTLVGSTTNPTTSRLEVAQSRTRTALRRVFGRSLAALRISCRLRAAGAATCAVSWRKSGARYSGKIYLRNVTASGGARRWQYRVDVTRRKDGHTTHVRRAYRVGGAR